MLSHRLLIQYIAKHWDEVEKMATQNKVWVTKVMIVYHVMC